MDIPQGRTTIGLNVSSSITDDRSRHVNNTRLTWLSKKNFAFPCQLPYSGDVGRRTDCFQGDSNSIPHDRRGAEYYTRPSDKNVVMLLHELVPGAQHRLAGRTGELHSPTYTVETEVNGQVSNLDNDGVHKK